MADEPGAPRVHPDGTVTYWSVYDQLWRTLSVLDIPDREWAAMSAIDRDVLGAVALVVGTSVGEDRCEICGARVGVGIRALHVGRCDQHPREPAPESGL